MNTDPQSTLFGDQYNDQHDGEMIDMLQHLKEFDTEDLKQLWPARLAEFFDVMQHSLKQQKTGLSEQDVNLVTATLVTAVAQHFGGLSFYLPHNEKLHRAIRDIKIWKAFTGNNYGQLAKQYRVSEMTIRTAVATQFKLRHRKVQPSLFEGASDV